MTDAAARETLKQYRLEATAPDGKVVSIGMDEAADLAERLGLSVDTATDAATLASRARDAQAAFDADPTDASARREAEEAHASLSKLLAENHVDDNQKRDDSYDRELLARGYTWEQIARSYRQRARSYRLDLTTYATRARNLENEVRATLHPLQTSTKLYRETMRQVLQAVLIAPTDAALARMMWEEIEDKLSRLGEDQSFRDDVRRFVRETFPDVSLLDAIDVPLTADQRVGGYHGE